MMKKSKSFFLKEIEAVKQRPAKLEYIIDNDRNSLIMITLLSNMALIVLEKHSKDM